MPDQILSGIIAGIVSLTISIIGIFVAKGQIRAQRERFEKEIESKRTDRLLEARMRVYPRFFEAASSLYKPRDPRPPQEEVHAEVLSEIQVWRKGEAMLILSKSALEAIFSFEEALKRNPENSRTREFSQEQKNKIFKARLKAMGALREDIGLLHEDENDRNLYRAKSRKRNSIN